MVTLYNAITIDGFVAKLNDSSEFTADDFLGFLKNYDYVIYGRRTYDDMLTYDGFPYEGINNVIYTSTPEKYKDIKGGEFTNEEPKTLISRLEKKSKKILLAGGGKTNSTFLKSGIIDEVIVCVHPIIFGDGIRLFDGEEIEVKLEKVESIELENGLIQIRYIVIK